jgi:hypothetical protein
MGRRLRNQELTPDFSFPYYGRIIARLSLLMRNSHPEIAFRIAPLYQKFEAMHFATVLHNTSFILEIPLLRAKPEKKSPSATLP